MSETLRDIMNRRIAFWQRRLRDRILAAIGVRSPNPKPSRFEQYVRRHGLETQCCYDRPPIFEDMDKLFELHEARSLGGFDPDALRAVASDSIPLPTIGPTVHFGEGIIGAFFGGEPMFSSTDVKTESVCRPVVTDWQQLDELHFDEGNPWVQRVLDCLRLFVARARGRYVLQPYCTIDGLNFVVTMRGSTQAFLDVGSRARELRRLMELGLHCAARYWNLQRDIVEESNRECIQHEEFAAMCPGHAGAGLSVDAYSLCRGSVYEELGVEYTQRLIDRLGGGFLHVHAIGAHLVPATRSLRGLTELTLADDPQCERYFPKLRHMRDCTGDLPLVVSCTLDEFRAGLRDHTLPGGVLYQVSPGAESLDEARRLVDAARAFRSSG